MREYAANNYNNNSKSRKPLTEIQRIAANKYKASWRSKNLHRYREYDRKRRVSKLNNGFEKYSEVQVLLIYGPICHICNKAIDLNASRRIGIGDGWEHGLHIDHLIPISMGGPDTLENTRPSHAICNLKKSSSML